MPFEDVIREVLSPVAPSTNLRWRRCVKCGSISYAPPLATCQVSGRVQLAGGQVVRDDGKPCGGELSRPPGWRTQLAPRWANGEPCTLEYYR